jgi:hypothetical protein
MRFGKSQNAQNGFETDVEEGSDMKLEAIKEPAEMEKGVSPAEACDVRAGTFKPI